MKFVVTWYQWKLNDDLSDCWTLKTNIMHIETMKFMLDQFNEYQSVYKLVSITPIYE